MAERRLGARPTVHLAYAFDRLLDAKLHNAYAILVPDQTHKIPARAQDIGEMEWTPPTPDVGRREG